MASGDSGKKLVIVDTDCGVDDAMAIMYLLSQPQLEIIAFTCTHGNTTLDNVALNVLTTMKVANYKKAIPIFEGAAQALVRENIGRAAYYHGVNGLGDSWERDPSLLEKIDRSEMAVNALIRLVKEHPNQITLICLGPLTNICLAHRMYPEFSSSLNSVFIMGGNIYGRGNGSRLGSEFNFRTDPESAHVVLNEFDSPTTLVPWEVCLDAIFEWSVLERMFAANTERSRFAESILEGCKKWDAGRLPGLTICDLAAVVILCHPEIVEKKIECGCVVELTGEHSTGTVFLDTRHSTDRKIRTFVEKVDKSVIAEEVIRMMKIE